MDPSKMPAKTLIDINSDELFEKHTIPEIQAVQFQIQNEIEKKREELRSMVGEKCRDLLKAADTITEMKGSSENVLLVINQAKELCQTLKERRLVGFKPPTSRTTKSSDNSEKISRMTEIKILLTLPEQIWSAIDDKNYLLGAQLFLFATHLQLGLEVASNAETIANNYPVLRKQWDIITSCKKIIVDGACRELKVIDISQEKAAECLCSLILLEFISYDKLLNLFLSLRMTSLDEILKSEELSRKKLRQTVEILQHTILILFTCFLDKPNKNCTVQSKLDSITGYEGKPTLSKVIQLSSVPEQYLSPLVINFQPKTPTNLTLLSQDHIRQTLSKWLENVELILGAELTKILLLIDDIKRLDKIVQEEIYEVKYPSNWDEIVKSLLGSSSLNIYKKFIKSYVTNRVKELIQIMWHNALNNIMECLKKVDEDMPKDSEKQPENDIRWYVWKENKMDTGKSLKLKTLGYTPRVIELCQKMDSFLMQLLDDVKLYVGENSVFLHKENEKDASDANVILPFLNSCSLDMIKRLAQDVKDSCKEEENNVNECKILIRARFLSSLSNQCPGLEKCLRYSIHVEEEFRDKSLNKTWQLAVTFLEEESLKLWDIWRIFTSAKLRNLIKTELGGPISLKSLLKSKPLSEVVTIEEQAEDGSKVQLDLRVPSQPSLPLQKLLFQICQQINVVIPHTLARQIHQDLVDSLVKDILEQYLEWSQSEIIYQSQAWQMLLDVRFLTLLLVTKENKELSEKICEILEKTIDPFDLDVYFPHLQNSVKKSTQKLQGSFGVLVNFSEKLPVFNGLKLSQSTGSQTEEPNLLAMSSNVPWFPLLPTTNIGVKRADSSREDARESYPKGIPHDKTNQKFREKENKKEETSNFFKSAGAFFDAMTGGWS